MVVRYSVWSFACFVYAVANAVFDKFLLDICYSIPTMPIRDLALVGVSLAWLTLYVEAYRSIGCSILSVRSITCLVYAAVDAVFRLLLSLYVLAGVALVGVSLACLIERLLYVYLFDTTSVLSSLGGGIFAFLLLACLIGRLLYV